MGMVRNIRKKKIESVRNGGKNQRERMNRKYNYKEIKQGRTQRKREASQNR